jgi:hypothetical protein
MQRLTNNDLNALEAALAKYGDHTPLDIKFRLPVLIAAARQTTPEPISEKHRDGNWWLVWERDYDGWREGKWHKSDKHWVNVYGSPAFGAPTHALPLPGRPEPPAPRGEE